MHSSISANLALVQRWDGHIKSRRAYNEPTVSVLPKVPLEREREICLASPQEMVENDSFSPQNSEAVVLRIFRTLL